MTVKAGMLPGDEFTLAEWKAARDKPKSLPPEIPYAVRLAYQHLLAACQRAGVPHFAVFVVADGINTSYDLLSKPENVPLDVLTARGTASGDIPHQMQLMALAFEGLDLSKLKGL